MIASGRLSSIGDISSHYYWPETSTSDNYHLSSTTRKSQDLLSRNFRGDNDRTRGVACRHTREDGRIDDEEVVRAPDLGVRVDNGVGCAGADHSRPGPVVRAGNRVGDVIVHRGLVQVG